MNKMSETIFERWIDRKGQVAIVAKGKKYEVLGRKYGTQLFNTYEEAVETLNKSGYTKV